MSLQRTVKWIQKTQGRDKFCKAIQYGCRFLKYRYQKNGDVKTAKKAQSLYVAMRDARKLFRLFKTLNQYKKLKDLLAKNPNLNSQLILNIIIRVSFGLYWIFDNLAIIAKLKLIQKDPKPYGKTGAIFWLIALVANIILSTMQYLNIHKKIQTLKRNYLSSPNQKQIQQKRKQYISQNTKKNSIILTLIKNFSDIISAGQASQFFPKVLGINATDGACGLGGLTSAVISSYQLYD